MKIKIKGFGLIEILISLFLSSLLLILLIKIFSIFESNANLISAINDIQDRGRMAFFILSNDIRMAGYGKCTSENNINSIEGYTDKNVPKQYLILAKENTDILIISRCIKKNDRNEMIKKAYFISNTYRTNRQNKPIYSLFEKRLPGKRRELIPNVINMKINYGIKENPVKHWKVVKVVEVGLLIESENKIIKQRQRYWFDNRIYNISDDNLTLPWYFFVGLRNGI